MSDAQLILITSAAFLGVFHTAIGIDHTLPFLVLARTRSWSLLKTLSVTAICGTAHVLSSIIVAAVGLLIGLAGSRLSWVEETRGTWAAWILVGFGVAYTAVALWKARTRTVRALDPAQPAHRHSLNLSDSADVAALPARRLMPALLIIFALGPCEALLPLLTASGMTLSVLEGVGVSLVFSLATLGTMLALVLLGYLGLSRLPGLESLMARFAPQSHVFAGLTLALSGLFIQILGV